MLEYNCICAACLPNLRQLSLVSSRLLPPGDTLGNIALLDIHGKELWEKHVKSMITQVRAGATVAALYSSTVAAKDYPIAQQ